MEEKPVRVTSGNPVSSGLALTPCSPVCPAKLFPALGLVSPPPTHIQPKRSSFSQDVLKTWLQVADRLSVCVRRSYPNAGKSASFSAVDPKGRNPLASKIEKRAKALSLELKVWSIRALY